MRNPLQIRMELIAFSALRCDACVRKVQGASNPSRIVRWGTWFLCLTIAASLQAFAQTSQSSAPVVLDSVVAVVNNQAILSSDIDDEIRLSVLDPGRGGLGVLTRIRALDQLIGRALIQQQIRQQDVEAAEPKQSEVDARLTEIRKELPACMSQDCATDSGWKAFLASHDLTEQRVEAYLRYRIEILRFIEQRFSQGINISPQDIRTYYRDTLLPQYSKGQEIPPLDRVSPQIEEILLQQRVNSLFDDWLGNLRKQGDVEVLDPALEAPALGSGPQQSSAAADLTSSSSAAPRASHDKGSQ